MIPETENLQEAKIVCPDKPARHAWADTLRRVNNVGFLLERLVYIYTCIFKPTLVATGRMTAIG